MDVGKREDQLLDKIGVLMRNRDNVKAWLTLYQDANIISPEVGTHLWEVLNGIDTEEPAIPEEVTG